MIFRKGNDFPLGEKGNNVVDTLEEWYHVVMDKGKEEGTLLFGGEIWHLTYASRCLTEMG